MNEEIPLILHQFFSLQLEETSEYYEAIFHHCLSHLKTLTG